MIDEAAYQERIARLTERQRSYLRLVLKNRNSKEIAAATGSSHRAVDKQLLKANNLLGVASRFDAARLLADHDSGVEPLPPATDLPSPRLWIGVEEGPPSGVIGVQEGPLISMA